ncbi:MAG: hypothetical protein AB6733_20960 [Clostridiaceae bacterium]
MRKKDYLYSVEITKKCSYSVMPGDDEWDTDYEYGDGGDIPVGTKGKIIEKFGDKFFKVDENQDLLDDLTIFPEALCLIPYELVDGNYKVIDESE